MQKLPQYFVIKRDASNPLWEKYINWLNEKYNKDFLGTDKEAYYGYNGNIEVGLNLIFFKNCTLITLEQWDEAVNGFVLPEKWCVKVTNDNLKDIGGYFNKQSGAACYINDTWIGKFYRNTNNRGENIVEGGGNLAHSFAINYKSEDFTEITFDQFKKEVLKENDMSYADKSLRNSNSKYEKEPTKDRTITAEQAQSIIDVACKDWQPRLAEMWGMEICLRTSVEITESFYKEMRRACTKVQDQLFDSIFGKDKKEFTSDELKLGEWFLYTANSSNNGNHFFRTNNSIICLETGKEYSTSSQFTGKKVRIKNIEFEEVND